MTGQETLHETLVETSTDKVLTTRKSSPFSPETQLNLLDSYLKRQAEAQRDKKMEEKNYSQKSLEEKQCYWLNAIMLQMRFQGESGFDEYAIFTPENYAEWLESEPEMERIIDFVIANIPDDTEIVRTEINRRLQR